MWQGNPAAQVGAVPAVLTSAALGAAFTATPFLRAASAGLPSESAARQSGAQNRIVICDLPKPSIVPETRPRKCVATHYQHKRAARCIGRQHSDTDRSDARRRKMGGGMRQAEDGSLSHLRALQR